MSTKIALISDSHSYLDHQTLNYLKPVDEIWHAGDIGNPGILDLLPSHLPLRAVYGNIDGQEVRNRFPEWLFFEVEGVRVLMTHIGGKPSRYAKGVLPRIKAEKPDLFVCGHSHICQVAMDSKNHCLYLNPGAIGQQGFHQMRTMLLLELESGKAKNLQVVELGRRGRG